MDGIGAESLAGWLAGGARGHRRARERGGAREQSRAVTIVYWVDDEGGGETAR